MLKQALAESRPLESRRRLEGALAKAERELAAPTKDRVQSLRALEVLDRIGTEDALALALLRTIAGGDPGARLTQEARALADRNRSPEPDEPFVGDPELEPPPRVEAIAPNPIRPPLLLPPRPAPIALWPMFVMGIVLSVLGLLICWRSIKLSRREKKATGS